jgi:hypothetical protein
MDPHLPISSTTPDDRTDLTVAGGAASVPDAASVQRHLIYGLSLPERALRGASAIVAGAVRESSLLLVPQAFRDSQTYSIMVRQTLDFLAQDVGGVKAPVGGAPPTVEGYVARKTVGNFLEMAGWATFHLSPLTVLAVLSDVAYGSRAYLDELAAELRAEGLIDEHSSINNADELLGAVARASATASSVLDTPPLSVEGLQQTIDEIRSSVARVDPKKLVPQAELRRLWDEIHELATRENVSPTEIASAATLSTLGKLGAVAQGALSGVRVAGAIVDRHLLTHYASALENIRQEGFYQSLQRSSQPYVEALWHNFSTDKTTVTEDLLRGRLFGTSWRAVRRWFGPGDAPPPVV